MQNLDSSPNNNSSGGIRQIWSRKWFNNKTSPTSGAPSSITSSSTTTTSQQFNFNHHTNNSRSMEQDEEMDFIKITTADSYDLSKAKQRASIKWLLSKAYNNKTPDELAEPFYKDHEGEDHLKPYIVKGLSDAEIYCLALCNLYGDPNYSQLSPFGIVQALCRKGSYVQAPPDTQLTETLLMQNRPLRINAHIAVIDAMMVLHVRELVSTDRVVRAVQKYGTGVHPHGIWFAPGEMPSDIEEAFLLWINRAVMAVRDYIQNTSPREHGLSESVVESWACLPLFQDLSDLADGVGLCALLAFYCSTEISLNEITVPLPSSTLSVSQCLWNLQLVVRVTKDSLPFNVCHLVYEDFLYLSERLKQNVFSFLADLYSLLEGNPCGVVKMLSEGGGEMIRERREESSVRLRRGFVHQTLVSNIHNLRPSLYSHHHSQGRSQSASSTPRKENTVQIADRGRKSSTNIILGTENSRHRSRSPSSSSVVSVPVRRSTPPSDHFDKSHSKDNSRYYGNSSEDSGEFVVHRSRNPPTLSALLRSVSPSSQEERSSPGSRTSASKYAKSHPPDDDEVLAAGRPSSLGAHKTSYAGRRSRRNSFSEADSQLTVENFGGSTENLNRFTVQPNPDKKPAIYSNNTPNSSEERGSYSRENRESEQVARSGRGKSVERNNRIFERSEDFFGEGLSRGETMFSGRTKKIESRGGEGGDYESGNFYEEVGEGRKENVTVFVVDREGGGGGGNSGENNNMYVRSSSMTNLSRLSDVQNKPINIVYLQSAPPPNGTSPLKETNESYRSPQNSSYKNTPPPSHNYDKYGTNGRGGGGERRSYANSEVGNYNDSRGYNNNEGRSYGSEGRGYYNNEGRSYGNEGRSYRNEGGVLGHNNSNYERQTSTSSSGGGTNGEDFDTEDLAAQLASIRQKLEEKRRVIEEEKGRMEKVASKQQFKIGRAAYLKAINKGKGSSSSGDGVNSGSSEGQGMTDSLNYFQPYSLEPIDVVKKELKLNVKDLESKWFNKTDDSCRTPEIENMDTETYQKSLAKIDSNLTELETDISRLSLQEEEINRSGGGGISSQNTFFLHNNNNNNSNSASNSTVGSIRNSSTKSGGGGGGRSTWGPPRPFNDSPSSNSNVNGMSNVNNGESSSRTTLSNSSSIVSTPTSFRLHPNSDSQGTRLFNRASGSETSGDGGETVRPTPPPRTKNLANTNNNTLPNSSSVTHAPIPTPPPDDMEPQSVSFVQDEAAVNNSPSLASIGSSRKSLQITSGSKTYRITPDSGSPPRPSAHRLFSDGTEPSSDETPSLNERGFYIPMDSVAPKRPKPPLRAKTLPKPPSLPQSPSKRDLSSDYVASIISPTSSSSLFSPPPPHSTLRRDEEFEEEERLLSRANNIGSSSKNRRRDFEEEDNEEGGGGVRNGGMGSDELDAMERKKERILLLSLKRKEEAEESRRVKEREIERRREEEGRRAEEKERKREEEKARKQAILESYRMKKQEDAERDGNGKGWEVQEAKKFLRPKSGSSTGTRPRPKTIHLSEVDAAGAVNMYGQRIGSGVLKRSDSQSSSSGLGGKSYGKKGSSGALFSGNSTNSGVDSGRSRSRRDPWGSTSSLNQDNRRGGTLKSYDSSGRVRSQSRPRDLSTSRIEARSRRDSFMASQDYLPRGSSTSSLLDGEGNSDSGVGTVSPPLDCKDAYDIFPCKKVSSLTASPSFRGGQKKGSQRPKSTASSNLHSPSNSSAPKPWPGSLPPGLMSRRNRFDDGASDISSVISSNMDYSGLRLYKQPTAKSNRSIILNAVEYCVFPGAVNRESKLRCLDEINRTEAQHFLIMFRDAGCQFRAIYAYSPENDEVLKLFGTGPRAITEDMFEKFFKYNSGGKCFSQVHTKHLTVTIDAFTIHNSLWTGKRGPVSKTKDMALVI